MAWKYSAQVATILTVLCCLASDLSAQRGDQFRARLTPIPVDGTTRDDITGIGSVSATLVGNRLSIAGTFEGLQGVATAASLRRGLATGVRGTAFHDLTVSHAAAGSISGALELTEDQAESLRNGQIYIQIDSEKGPDGNLWGWLLN